MEGQAHEGAKEVDPPAEGAADATSAGQTEGKQDGEAKPEPEGD